MIGNTLFPCEIVGEHVLPGSLQACTEEILQFLEADYFPYEVIEMLHRHAQWAHLVLDESLIGRTVEFLVVREELCLDEFFSFLLGCMEAELFNALLKAQSIDQVFKLIAAENLRVHDHGLVSPA